MTTPIPPLLVKVTAPGREPTLHRIEKSFAIGRAPLNDLVLDPRNPDVLIATTYQRHRKVWGFIDGGPESGIHRSTDGGASWTKSQRGLPDVDLGRIGLGVSPADPDVVYAIVEAAEEAQKK